MKDWREEPVGKHHDRKGFNCGTFELNQYLVQHARQAHERGAAKTYVAIKADTPTRVIGYYTLSLTSLAFDVTPDTARRGLGRHEVPLFRLARLAVDQKAQGQGLGGGLLVAAAERCQLAAGSVGGIGLIIDAKDERAAGWYLRFGAMPLASNPLILVLPFTALLGAGQR
jgi:GNAT superfamily N-acetyltransferase